MSTKVTFACCATAVATPASKAMAARTARASDGTERVVFVLGGARSGTTWLAKILDSHPDVLYRHEPDIALRGDLSADLA